MRQVWFKLLCHALLCSSSFAVNKNNLHPGLPKNVKYVYHLGICLGPSCDFG